MEKEAVSREILDYRPEQIYVKLIDELVVDKNSNSN
jgi:hypothetical protein